ncbi:MAG: type II toxin-antitoxin system VapC family toxin [Desulfocapsa sp.]|nr:type II toxin-antitoxin system VapC family toxin [Desulfocapsa sp.]
MYLLDTDIIIYSLKGNKSVINNIQNHADSPKAISVITYGELVYGAEKSQHIATNLAKVHRLREIFPVIELSCAIMDTFASIKAELSKSGNMVGDFDLLIAATAISIGYCVVSNNEKHFIKISGLKYENWAKD